MDYSVWYMGIWYLDYEYIEEGWRPVSWRWKHREVEPYANRTDLILLDIDDYYKEISRIMTANYWIFYFFYNKRRSSWNCLIIFLTNRAGSFLYFYLCKKLILFVFWVDSPLITLKWNLKHGIPIIKTIYLQPEIVILCLFSFNIFLLKLFFMYNKLFLHKTASYDEYTRLLYKIKNKKENIELFFNIVFFSFYSFKVYFLKNSLNLSKHFFCKFFYVVLNCYLIMRKEITKYPITINSLNYSWYFYKYKNSSFFITRVKNRYSILLIITRFFFFFKKKKFFYMRFKNYFYQLALYGFLFNYVTSYAFRLKVFFMSNRFIRQGIERDKITYSIYLEVFREEFWEEGCVLFFRNLSIEERNMLKTSQSVYFFFNFFLKNYFSLFYVHRKPRYALFLYCALSLFYIRSWQISNRISFFLNGEFSVYKELFYYNNFCDNNSILNYNVFIPILSNLRIYISRCLLKRMYPFFDYFAHMSYRHVFFLRKYGKLMEVYYYRRWEIKIAWNMFFNNRDVVRVEKEKTPKGIRPNFTIIYDLVTVIIVIHEIDVMDLYFIITEQRVISSIYKFIIEYQYSIFFVHNFSICLTTDVESDFFNIDNYLLVIEYIYSAIVQTIQENIQFIEIDVYSGYFYSAAFSYKKFVTKYLSFFFNPESNYEEYDDFFLALNASEARKYRKKYRIKLQEAIDINKSSEPAKYVGAEVEMLEAERAKREIENRIIKKASIRRHNKLITAVDVRSWE